jgi:hypothetical protein
MCAAVALTGVTRPASGASLERPSSVAARRKRHLCVSSRRAEERAANATTLRVMDEFVAFEQAVLAQAPPGALLVGASVSPDGKYGAALTLQPGANYQMDDVLVRRGDRWEPHSGGSGAVRPGPGSVKNRTLGFFVTEAKPPREHPGYSSTFRESSNV